MNERYLLQIRLSNGNVCDMLFDTEDDMREFILDRDFFFITADYTTYDLAIELK